MTDYPILFTHLNDFGFCPVSIYFHNLMNNADRVMSQSKHQINGSHAHKSIDEHNYSTKKSILQGTDVYSETYDLMGKIDLFDSENGILTERKKKISRIFDGHIFQLYAQYFALKDMGFSINKIRIHSMDDNKNYDIPLPEDDLEKKEKFEAHIEQMRVFDVQTYVQTNPAKCSGCIYEPMCGCSCVVDGK